MTASKDYTATIVVKEYLREGAVYVLTSDDMPGLFLAGQSINDLRADVPGAIEGLYNLNYGMKVKVVPSFKLADFSKVTNKSSPQPIGWTLYPCAA